MPRYNKHIFVCENKRESGDPRGCCQAKGSAEIRGQFKKRIKELGLNTRMRANSAGCLDACVHGPVVVIYPEQIWYGGVKLEDAEEIIQQHLVINVPVERLQIKEKKFL